MDNVIVYLALSGAFGVFQFYETFKLYRHDEVKINWMMGLIETAWFIVSCIVLWKLDFTLLEQSVVVIFIASIVSGTISLSDWFNRAPENTLGGFVIPTWYIYLSFFLEFVFVTLCMWALLNHEIKDDSLSSIDYLKENIIIISSFIVGIFFVGAAFWLLQKKGLQWLKDDVREAIINHPICFDVFGDVEHIELDQETTDEYEEKDIFAYFVTGEKSSGVLVAEIKTNIHEGEEIIHGYIELSDGEIIEIEEPERKAF